MNIGEENLEFEYVLDDGVVLTLSFDKDAVRKIVSGQAEILAKGWLSEFSKADPFKVELHQRLKAITNASREASEAEEEVAAPKKYRRRRRAHKVWRASEDALLKRIVKSKGASEKTYRFLAKELGRTVASVRTRISLIRLGKEKSYWKLPKKITFKYNEAPVDKRVPNIAMSAPDNENKSWTENEVAVLKREVKMGGGPTKGNLERVARLLGRSFESVRIKFWRC